jgi:hypothetical protein
MDNWFNALSVILSGASELVSAMTCAITINQEEMWGPRQNLELFDERRFF